MKIRYSNVSIAGPKGENQDAILLPFEVGGAYWCAIADGVGSASLGGLAARKSIEEVKQASEVSVSMQEVFEKVSHALAELAVGRENDRSISTTLSVLKLVDYAGFVGHAGDSRISHYRGSGVVARTKDQTEVQKLLDDGVLSKNQARRYPRRNVLLSAMSAGREYNLYETRFSVQSGDRILLTTDGFHGKLLRGKIADLSSAHPSFDDFWSIILSALTDEKLDDDASCLAVEIE